MTTGPPAAGDLLAPAAAAEPARRVLFGRVVSGALLLAALAWVAVSAADRSAEAFFATGRDTTAWLATWAEALRHHDLRGARAVYAADFRSPPLGLGRPRLAEERDGVRRYVFTPPPATAELDADGAVAEWAAYLDGFASLQDLELHLDRLERWPGPVVVGTARFELVGTPRGERRPAVDRGRLRVRLEVVPGAPGGYRLRSVEWLGGERVVASEARFDEVGAAAGIDFVNRPYPPLLEPGLRFGIVRFGPGGIAAADVDGDGRVDLFVPDGVASHLFRNRGDGTFEDVTAAAGLAGLSGVSVALFADVDDDGARDLFVSRTFAPNQLFHNRGDGTFEDVTAGSGLGADTSTAAASFADVDRDGDLDLYLGRYIDPRHDLPTTFYARNGEPNRLYRNDGGGRFTDVTRRAGVGDPGLCLATSFGDVDDDGDPDLYVVNDFGRNTLYRNAGDGTFEDVTVDAGALDYGAGMSASFGDADNDGRLDLYVTNIRSDHAWFAAAPTVRRYFLNTLRQGVWRSDLPLYLEIARQTGPDFVAVFRQMSSGNTLLRNRGDGTFEDVTAAAGAAPPGWYWGSAFADLDNDGRLDIYSADGWVYGRRGTDLELDFLHGVVDEMRRYKAGDLFDPAGFGGRSWHGWERNRLLRNDGDGTFTEIGLAAGAALLRNSRGVAVADFRNRGVLDLAVAASGGRHALLANRPDPGRHWVSVEVVGAGRDLADGSPRDAVGTRLTLAAGGLRQVREVVLGDGYASQNDLRQHFGLGAATRIDELTVRWPRSGREERFRDLPADRFYRLREGAGTLEAADASPAGSPVR